MKDRDAITSIEIAERLQSLRDEGMLTAWLEELLWFIQATHSNSLDSLAGELVSRFPDRLGTECLSAGKLSKPRLSRAEALEFWGRVPLEHQSAFAGVVPDAFAHETVNMLLDTDTEEMHRERAKGIPEIETRRLRTALEGLATNEIRAKLSKLCRPCKTDSSFERAVTTCEAPDLACWSFRDLEGALRSLLAERAESAKRKIALTCVVEKVFEALDFAWSENVTVQVEGDPRYGKTEAITAFCDAYPGRARLVTVPCETTDADFVVAVAEALGVPVGGPSVRVADLRRKIDFVLKNSRLLLIFDEAHFLIPQCYSEATPPKRMNWVRTRVIDRRLPAALLVTPQSFDGAFRKYVRKTAHRFEQFDGRIARFKLPATLEEKDVVAVARIHFPEIELPYLRLIAGKAMMSTGNLQAVETTARFARFLAKKAGRAGNVTGEDVRQAIAEMMPCKAPAKPIQTSGSDTPAAQRNARKTEISEEEPLAPSRVNRELSALVA